MKKNLSIHRHCCALTAVALIFPTTTWAEDAGRLLKLNLAQLGEIKVDTVFAASKHQEKVTDAPSSVSIVTREEIQRFGYRTLAEIMRGVRGFDVTDDREYSYATAGGLNRLSDYGTRTLLLVDGHRMNDPLYNAASVGTEGLLDVDLIERVEFIRGPGSAIYGSNAFFAVVNIITRQGRAVNGVETSGSFGTFNAYTARVTLGKKLACGLEYFLSGTTYESEGNDRLYYKQYDTPQTNHGVAVKRDADRFWSTFGKVSYGDFTLQGGYVTRVKDVPTGSFGAVFNSQVQDSDSRGYAELRYAHETESHWELNARVFYDTYDYYSTGHFPGPADDVVINNDSSRQRWWGAEASIGRAFQFLEGFRFKMGVDYSKTLQLRLRSYDEVSPRVLDDTIAQQEVFGVYLDTHTQLTQRVGIAAGLRYDTYNSFGDTLNPRLGLILKPWKNTTVKLLYGQAFRAPDAREEKSHVKPESIRTYELVGEQYFSAHWHATVSIFQNDITDLIDNTSNSVTGKNGVANVCDARVRGASVEVEGKSDTGWMLRASYSRHQATDAQIGTRLINSPQDLAKLQLGIPLYGEKLSANIEFLYVGDRLTYQRQDSGTTWLMNATLFSHELAPGLDLSASIYNLLDQHYRVPGSINRLQDTIEQDGRAYRLKLTYRF